MDEKCSARMLAFLVASLCTTPWCRSGDMPEQSLPVDLMKDQNLFCLVCLYLVCWVRMCSQWYFLSMPSMLCGFPSVVYD